MRVRTAERPGDKLGILIRLISLNWRHNFNLPISSPAEVNFEAACQIQWPAHPRRAPVERLGGSARRSRPASLVAPFAAVGGRRSAVGGRPVRRGALRLDEIQFQPIFSFRIENTKFAPGELRHWEVTARVHTDFLSFFGFCLILRSFFLIFLPSWHEHV